MGSQISFLHTEEDVISFLEEIEKNDGRIIIDGKIHCPSKVNDNVLLQMSSFACKFKIVCSYQQNLEECHSDLTVAAGTAIEFLNCCKGNALSRTYEVGRLYITKNEQGIYDSKTYLLYKKLCTYIKKGYLYSNRSHTYFSPTFKHGTEQHYLYASCLGRPIHF